MKLKIHESHTAKTGNMIKKSVTLIKKIAFIALSGFNLIALAQQALMEYFRLNNQKGLHTFETTKNDTTPFTGMKLRVGGNFTQDFQMLSHKNNVTPVIVNGVNTNQLASITNGFNLAMANLNIDAQLEDGIRMNLTM